MKKEHIDSGLYEILHFTPEVSSETKEKIDIAYAQIINDAVHGKRHTHYRQDECNLTRRHKTNNIFTTSLKGRKRTSFYLGFAAAVILALGFIGFSNPVMAGKIPFIGRIFSLVESNVGYPGNFSENSIEIAPPDIQNENEDTAYENSGANGSALNADASAAPASSTAPASPDEGITYSQTANGVTITLSEASYTEMALYYSLELYCEEGFPEDFNRVKNMEDYILSYDLLYMQSRQSFDFTQADPSKYPARLLAHAIDEGLPAPYSIQGNFIEPHTFLGIMRVDLSIIRDILQIDALPEEFTYSFTIDKLWGELKEYKEVDITNSETGEVSTIKNAVRKYYEGPWSFSVPVALDQTPSQTREIMETNSDGVGIASVTKTQYEISADIILPEDANPIDYVVAITDADGKILESQGNLAEIYSVYGRNTDTVYVYVVDYETYMDECKADNAYRLPEKALFQTKIEW